MIYPQLFVGIDISKFKHVVAILNEAKQLLGKVFEVGETQAGYQHLLATFQHLEREYHVREFRIGMEATGDYWKNLYHFLTRQSPRFLLTVINPVQTKRFAQGELRRAKTDAVDALTIARFMAEKKPRPALPNAMLLDTIKDLDRQIHALHKQHTMTLNKLRIELGKVAPEIERRLALAHHQQALVLLKHFPTAEAIAHASFDELRTLRYGKKHWRLSRPFIIKMQTLAQNSVAYKAGPGAGLVVQALVELLGHQREMVAKLKAHTVQLYQRVNERPSLLATIPGISPETAIALEAYIGDVTRFPKAKHLVAYFGMNPTVNLSGIVTKRASSLQKKGCAVVRHKLFMAVLNMISKRVEPFFSYYQRLVAAGKPKLVAIVATMRKLLVIIYALLSTQQLFHARKNPAG
jgi:transposase